MTTLKDSDATDSELQLGQRLTDARDSGTRRASFSGGSPSATPSVTATHLHGSDIARVPAS